jgi:uncharacterized membrane protein
MAENNPNSRLEAFCDGVFAIALTLLIIDIKIPSTAEISTTADFWLALKHITPSILSFVLSFIIILITWVNHHNSLKLLNRSSSPFIYANGLLLLSVVFVPFPASLMGEYLLTDNSAPAVILYDSTLALQAFAWILLGDISLRKNLTKNKKANLTIQNNLKFAYFAFVLYSLCAIIAFWFPLIIAIVTTISWIFWLIYGLSVKNEDE